ncbi:MAG: M20 family metallopeptidase, partial [Zavarzinia sp.]|nr:M20 family metallopeptidase [Zavarzinia sp.]
MTDAVALTRDLLRLRSINPPGDEGAVAEVLGRLLEDGGFHVRRFDHAPDRPSLVATRGTGAIPALCFTGHLDTVPLGTTPWHHDPFAGEIADGRLYGRGSSDMKSGVAAMVVAALDFARNMPDGNLALVLTAGEETGCDGARHLATLDGALPKVGALVVGEPTANYPLIGHKGALWLQAEYSGVTAHGSMPEQGVNALYKAARGTLCLAEHRFAAQPHRHLGRASLNVGTLQGGINVNSVPDRARVGIDIRTVPGQRNSEVYCEIADLLGPEASLKRVVDVDHVITSPTDDWIQHVFALAAETLGEPPEPRGASYFTDASILTPAFGDVPTVI